MRVENNAAIDTNNMFLSSQKGQKDKSHGQYSNSAGQSNT